MSDPQNTDESSPVAGDFSNEAPPEDLSSEPTLLPYDSFRPKDYDPRPHEDAARRRIAYILLGLLSFSFVAPVVLLVRYPEHFDNLLKLYQLIFTPLIALVSAATGFYYGTKSK